jgi:hypothetical protein
MEEYGNVDLRTGLITVNKKKNGKPGELLDTLVHEKMHLLHQKMKENKIRKLTDKAKKKMSAKSKRKLLNKII